MPSIQSILKKTSSTLPPLDAELLLAHVFQQSREFVVMHPDKEMTLRQILHFRYLTYRRKKGFPLAYLLGYQYFYGKKFLVNRHTLIPRPETEHLVERVLDTLPSMTKQLLLIDVGTGSGCIPISIAQSVQEAKNQHKIKRIFAVDISNGALSIAKKNAERHKTPMTFLHGSLLRPILKQLEHHASKDIIVTANLPYITEAQFQSEASIQHEPKTALVAADQGLALYKELLQQIKDIQHRHSWHIFLEIDPDQKGAITTYIQTEFPQAKLLIHDDLAGLARVVEIKSND